MGRRPTADLPEAALVVGDSHWSAIGRAAAKYAVVVAIGYSERESEHYAAAATNPSTISRGVRRNISNAGNHRPSAHTANLARQPRLRLEKSDHDNAVRDFVQDRLEQRWGLQQICHALTTEFAGEPEKPLVHATIYQTSKCSDAANCGGSLPGRCVPDRPKRQPPPPRQRPPAGRIVDP